MEGKRAPQGLDAEDRIALGLTAQHLAYLVIASLAAYATLTSHLPGFLKYPAGVLAMAAGALLAWGRLAHRPVDTWLWLGARFYARPRRSGPPPREAARDAPGARSGTPEPVMRVAEGPPDAALGRLAGYAGAGAPVGNIEVPAADTAEAAGGPAPGDDVDGEGIGRILSLPRDGRARVADEDGPAESPLALADDAPVFIGATTRIAFFSLKGGAGKTTLACEVAALLARDARHRVSVGSPPERLRVALLDVDMGSANVSMRVGLTHPTLWDLVLDPTPDATRIEDCLLEHDDTGLRVLLGPPRAIASAESRALAMQRIAQVFSYLDEHRYHFVFVDMGSEVNELTTYVLEAVHRVYYVLTPTASGVQDTYRGVETLRRMGHRAKLRFVLNQGRGAFDATEMLSDLGGELAATVSRDDAFLGAEDDHSPASLSIGEARNSVSTLARAIYPGFVDLPATPSVWRRLRHRLG